jgi:acyl-CoA synthetase (AMP-forming)/AMP-acid ligase II
VRLPRQLLRRQWPRDVPEPRRGGGGWLRTGALEVEDEEGYLSIVGRLEDMYIPGGETAYPAEVEQGVYAHPAVAECPVIGAPDENWVAWRPGERSS